MRNMNLLIISMITLTFLACNDIKKSSNKTEEKETIVAENPAQLTSILLKKIQFNGVEPNWTLIFKEDYAEYTPMGKPTSKIFYKKSYGDDSKPKLSEVAKLENGVMEFQGSVDGWGTKFTIKKENCSDGISNKTYPYSVKLMIDEYDEMQGCGQIK